MKSAALALHILSIGLWLDCVLTEALFERALLSKGRESERHLAKLHKQVDIWIEIPTFTIVVLTGAWLCSLSDLTPLLITKIIFGLIAVLANIYCVQLVFQRNTAAQNNDWNRFTQLDHRQHKVGAVVLLAILMALLIGLIRTIS